jgi:hypothetical protein
MQTNDRARMCAEISKVAEGSASELDTFFGKWFEKNFVKQATLARLRRLQELGRLKAYVSLLGERNDVDVIAALKKADPHVGADVLGPSKLNQIDHLVALAEGRTQPASKPQKRVTPKPVVARPKTGSVLTTGRQ